MICKHIGQVTSNFDSSLDTMAVAVGMTSTCRDTKQHSEAMTQIYAAKETEDGAELPATAKPGKNEH